MKAANTPEEILTIIKSMKEDRQEVVLVDALELWEAEGCPLQGPGCGEELSSSYDNNLNFTRL